MDEGDETLSQHLFLVLGPNGSRQMLPICKQQAGGQRDMQLDTQHTHNANDATMRTTAFSFQVTFM